MKYKVVGHQVWKQWWAWYPVPLGEYRVGGENTYAWLIRIERRQRGSHTPWWEYREIA